MWPGRRDPEGTDVMNIFTLLFGWLTGSLEDDPTGGDAGAELDPDG